MVAGGVDGSCVGNDSKVAGWTEDAGVGGKVWVDTTRSVGLVGDGGSNGESEGRGATLEVVRALPEPSIKSIILIAELR